MVYVLINHKLCNQLSMHLFSCPSHAYIYIWHTYIPAISDNNNRWGSWSKEVCGFPCWRLTCQASLLWPQWQQICQVTMILHLGRVEHGGYGYVMIYIWMIMDVCQRIPKGNWQHFFVQLPHCALDLWKGSRVYPTLWRRWSLSYALLRAHCNADGQ